MPDLFINEQNIDHAYPSKSTNLKINNTIDCEYFYGTKK